MIKKNLVITFFLCIGLSTFSQSVQQDYLNAKAFFKSGKYNLAMEAFKPITQNTSDKAFAPYASFYYAISAYKQNYPALARDMFLQLNERFPKWKNKAEVNHWLSKIYFEQGDITKGLEYAQDPSLEEENRKQKRFYLAQNSSIEELTKLYEDNPTDTEIGHSLAKAIAAQPLADQDRNMLLMLIDKLKLDPDAFGIGQINESVKKDRYKVAVIMPFMFEKLTPSLRKKSNQFVYDLYEGMQLAVDNLEQAGVNIDLYAYDTEKSWSTTKVLLEKEELKSMDLIIGPLYPDPSQLVSDFSYANKINMINPLSANAAVIGNNPYSFLYQPQYATQALAAAQYAIKNLSNKVSAIFYGGSEADSIKAFTYKSAIEEDSFQVVMMRKVPKDTSRQVLKILTSTYNDVNIAGKDSLSAKELKQFFIAKDSIGSIYVASDDRLLASGVVSSVEIRGDSIAVIGSGKWLEYRFIDYAAYERLGIALVAANYIVAMDTTHQYLNEYCIQKYASPASNNMFYGYDLMTFMGHNLYRHGKYFQKNLYGEEFNKGTLLVGYSYLNANDNQYVPILRFKDNQIEIINLPDLN